MSIHKENKNIKGVGKIHILYSLIMVLVAFSAYGIGLLQNFNEPKEVTIGQSYEVLNLINNRQNEDQKWQFLASKNGSVYYPISCGSASRVKKENRVYFDSKESAETAGFTPSKQCDF